MRSPCITPSPLKALGLSAAAIAPLWLLTAPLVDFRTGIFAAQILDDDAGTKIETR
jgi:hypothetical protein